MVLTLLRTGTSISGSTFNRNHILSAVCQPNLVAADRFCQHHSRLWFFYVSASSRLTTSFTVRPYVQSEVHGPVDYGVHLRPIIECDYAVSGRVGRSRSGTHHHTHWLFICRYTAHSTLSATAIHTLHTHTHTLTIFRLHSAWKSVQFYATWRRRKHSQSVSQSAVISIQCLTTAN